MRFFLEAMQNVNRFRKFHDINGPKGRPGRRLPNLLNACTTETVQRLRLGMPLTDLR
jgi:hypothetical protein